MWNSIKGMKQNLLLITAGLLLSLVGVSPSRALANSSAGDFQVAVVISGEASLYAKALLALKQASPETTFKDFTVDEWDADNAVSTMNNESLVVAIGARATAKLLQEKADFSLLSIMVPSVTFNEMVENDSALQEKIAAGKLSAIYMDQPATRQFNLAKLIDPELKTIGTLYENRSDNLVAEMRNAAEKNHLVLKAKKLSRDDNPIVALREMYREIDIFIAIPGKYIFNKSVAKWMLYLSYKNKKPLLGFSADYVSAGALAAVYSGPENIARQAGEWIDNYQRDERLLFSPDYPSYFSVTTNAEVAGRLNIRLDSEAEIEHKLSELESG